MSASCGTFVVIAIALAIAAISLALQQRRRSLPVAVPARIEHKEELSHE